MQTTVSEPGAIFIAKAGDVGSRSSYGFEYLGDRAVLVNINGNFLAYVNKCTHLGCALELKRGVFRCPCHASEFDPLTGESLKGPAKKPLKSIEVYLEGDGVYARA